MRNRYKINLDAFINIRANRFAFINTTYTVNTTRFLNVKTTRLKRPIAIKGFNRRQGKVVTYILILYLFINKH